MHERWANPFLFCTLSTKMNGGNLSVLDESDYPTKVGDNILVWEVHAQFLRQIKSTLAMLASFSLTSGDSG